MITCVECDYKIPCWNDEDDDEEVGPGTQMLVGYYHCPYDNHVHSGRETCRHTNESKKMIAKKIKMYETMIGTLKQYLEE